jgi:hypothetical protein
METDGQLEYWVRDLPTRSVKLYPARAQVIRDIKSVSLKVCLSDLPSFPCLPAY